jgi:hypothetical protein
MAAQSFATLEHALHEQARAETGLSDFGDTAYLEGLRVFLRALDTGPRFTEAGRAFTRGNIKGVLKARLHAQQGWKANPEYRSVRIARPLVITGIPRTGTTALHKLLSMDTQFQGLERWLTATPIPRPPRATWEANPLYQACVADMKAFFDAAPAMKAAHDMVADEVDECLEVLKQDFCSNNYGSSWRVPEYDAWWLRQSERSAYERFADVLRLVGCRERDKPWLLKNPGHIWELDSLLEIFPDACVVQTHRDPAKAIPSLCSVLGFARGIIEGDKVDLEEIGARELNNWSIAAQRSLDARARLEPAQFIDVMHADFHADPLTVVKRIYTSFGFRLDGATESRMRDWIAANPAGKLGDHRYTLEQFGLSRAAIRESFAAYDARYGFA